VGGGGVSRGVGGRGGVGGAAGRGWGWEAGCRPAPLTRALLPSVVHAIRHLAVPSACFIACSSRRHRIKGDHRISVAKPLRLKS